MPVRRAGDGSPVVDGGHLEVAGGHANGRALAVLPDECTARRAAAPDEDLADVVDTDRRGIGVAGERAEVDQTTAFPAEGVGVTVGRVAVAHDLPGVVRGHRGTRRAAEGTQVVQGASPPEEGVGRAGGGVTAAGDGTGAGDRDGGAARAAERTQILQVAVRPPEGMERTSVGGAGADDDPGAVDRRRGAAVAAGRLGAAEVAQTLGLGVSVFQPERLPVVVADEIADDYAVLGHRLRCRAAVEDMHGAVAPEEARGAVRAADPVTGVEPAAVATGQPAGTAWSGDADPGRRRLVWVRSWSWNRRRQRRGKPGERHGKPGEGQRCGGSGHDRQVYECSPVARHGRPPWSGLPDRRRGRRGAIARVRSPGSWQRIGSGWLDGGPAGTPPIDYQLKLDGVEL